MNFSLFFNTVRQLREYHSGALKLRSYPLVTAIEVTNACNAGCGYCPINRKTSIFKGSGAIRSMGFMSDKTFSSICQAKYARSLRNVRPFLHGEPLMHPQLPNFVGRLKRYSDSVGITSNASLLTEKKAEALVSAGLTGICFSFEGVSKGIYESIRMLPYELVEWNILKFLELKNKTAPHIYVELGIVRTSLVEPYLADFVKKWRETRGVDAVIVQTLVDWAGLVNISRFDHNVPRLTRWKAPCIAPWTHLTIWWDGTIAPCCTWESATSECFGNINRDDLYEVWNSPKYFEFRRRHRDGVNRGVHQVCDKCDARPMTAKPFLIQKRELLYPFSASFGRDLLVPSVLRRLGQRDKARLIIYK